MNDDTIIQLQSEDGPVFEIKRRYCKNLKTIDNLLADIDPELDGDNKVPPIPVPIRSSIMPVVIGYAEMFGEGEGKRPIPKKSNQLYFIAEDRRIFDNLNDAPDQHPSKFDLVIATNYLDFEAALWLALKSIANQIPQKNIEELKTFFGVSTEPFTVEEKARCKEMFPFLLQEDLDAIS